MRKRATLFSNNRGNLENDVGERLGSNGSAGSQVPNVGIFSCNRFSIGLNATVGSGYNPDFRYTGLCVCRQLDGAIKLNAAVGNLNEQEHIAGSGVVVPVEVIAPLQEHYVRLGFAEFVESYRVLNGDHSATLQDRWERIGEEFDAAGVPVPDWGHNDEISVQQLDSVIFREDTGVGHGVVFGHGETAADRSGDRQREGYSRSGHLGDSLLLTGFAVLQRLVHHALEHLVGLGPAEEQVVEHERGYATDAIA